MELLIQVARCLAASAAARLLLPAKQAVPLVLIREPPPIRAELLAGLRRHASVSAPRSLDVHTGRLYLSRCVCFCSATLWRLFCSALERLTADGHGGGGGGAVAG